MATKQGPIRTILVRRSIGPFLMLFALDGHAQFIPGMTYKEITGAPMYPADIDLDGDLDWLCPAGSKGIIAFLYEGPYTYGHPILLFQDTITAPAYADFDGDGDLDLAYAEGSNGYQGVSLLMQNTPLNFQQTLITTASTSFPSQALTAFDIDSDGDVDLIWRLNLDFYHLDNLGGGAFAAPALIGTFGLTKVEHGDVDMNGTEDLLIISPADSAIQVLSNSGGGAFSSPQTLVMATGLINEFDVGDLDGDLDLDVVVNSNYALTAYFNNGGAFSTSMVLLSGAFWLEPGFLVSDLDQDGDQDVIGAGVTDENPFWVENLGGTFASPVDLCDLTDVYSVYSVISADVDNDGDQDLYYNGSGYVNVLWYNDGNQVFDRRLEMPYAVVALSPSASDMDGDGDLDAVSPYPEWHRNDGGSDFSYRVRTKWSWEFSTLASTPCDLDGDGDTDYLFKWVTGVYYKMLNDGTGQFSDPVSLGVTGQFYDVGDLDQDGDIDIAVAMLSSTHWYANDGSGTFSYVTSLGVTGTDFVRILDVDGDQDMDICASVGTALVLLRNSGGAVFTSQLITGGDPSTSIAAGDVDGDGDVDLIACDYGIRLHRSDGIGGYLPVEMLYSTTSTYSQVALKDVDNDNRPDLFFSMSESDSVYVAWSHNDGTSPFDAYEILGASPTPCNGHATFTLFDSEGDGDTDVLVSDVCWTFPWYSSLSLHLNQSGGSCAAGGSVFVDQDLDEVQGTIEPGFLHALVVTSPFTAFLVTDTTGQYAVPMDTGSFTMSCSLPDPWWQLTTDSASYAVHLDTAGAQVSGLSFGYAPTVDTTLVKPFFVSSATRCEFAIEQWVGAVNVGTTGPLEGYLQLTLDPLVTFNSSVIAPDSVVGNNIYWGFDDLDLFEQWTMRLNVDMPGVAYIGDTIHATVTVFASDDGGLTFHDSTLTWWSVIACAYDPNDKLVDPAGFGPYGAIDLGTEELEYTVRFQNTGLDTALNVIIRDALSPDLVWNTMEVIATSHTLTGLQIDAGGTATFSFENIFLPDSNVNEPASHGFIKFRIATQPGLPSGTMIENSVGIYFDFNPPVLTNATLSTLVDCGLFQPEVAEQPNGTLNAPYGISHQWYFNGVLLPGDTLQSLDPQSDGNYSVAVTDQYGCTATTSGFWVGVNEVVPIPSLVIYPNPARTVFRVIATAPLTEEHVIEVIDLHGRTLLALRGVGFTELQIERGDLSSGIYMVRVLRDGIQETVARVVLD